ncbi:serine/threonine-protein kinase [Corynebacterium sp.]|uniref:serine/threonine-protein kinase n=1 Tax=Corynebacterium sp. TaxID=1720 RepID=UPI0028B0FDDE|nr:serine/threonine-protein kinase [Corynebacterium sp.]
MSDSGNWSGDPDVAQLAAELEARRNLTDLTLIGQGGMGHVYRAYDQGLHRWVAVKAVRPDVVGSGGEGYRRFLAEMRTLATIRHTSVVNIHYADALSSSGTAAYFVMDYVDGGDLEDALAERRRTGRRFTVGEVDRILRPVAEALDHIHHRNPPVVHRDLKPANILLPRDPHSAVGTTAVLTDFGISIAGDDTRVTSTGLVIGTEKYMAPEIFTVASTYGAHLVDYSPGTDRYALALIALEMLTLTAFRDTMSTAAWRGERTLPRLTAEALAEPDGPVAPQVAGVLRRALDNDPSRRFPTAVAFLDAVRDTGRGQVGQTREVPVAWAGAAPTPSHPAPPAASGASGARRWKVPVALLAVVAVVGALGVLGFVGYRQFMTPGWEASDARIVNAFPDLLPQRQGQEGWRDMTCDGGDPQGEEEARVTCHGDGLTMAVVDFGSEETRSAYVPASGAEQLEADGCRIRVAAPAESGGAMSVFPETGDRTRYAMLLTGAPVDSASSATDVVGNIPVC